MRMRPLDFEVEMFSSGVIVVVSGIYRLARERELQPKIRAGAQLTLHFNVTAVLPHNAITDRKSEARTLLRAFGSEERIVDALQVLRINSLPRINNVHDDMLII